MRIKPRRALTLKRETLAYIAGGATNTGPSWPDPGSGGCPKPTDPTYCITYCGPRSFPNIC